MLYQHKTDFKKTYLYIDDKKVYDIHLTALISKLLLKILPFNILYCPKYWHCYVTILERLNYLLLSWKKRNFTEARTWYIQKSIKVSCWDELRLLHLLYFFHLDTEHKFNIQNFQNLIHSKKPQTDLFLVEMNWGCYTYSTLLTAIHLDTEHKFNIQSKLPERLLNVLWTFKLRPVSRGYVGKNWWMT